MERDREQELQDAVIKEIKERTAEMMRVIAEKAKEVVWDIANNYIENYLEVDVVLNYDSSVRDEVTEEANKWAISKKDCWGMGVRRLIFEEHKDVILPMIEAEQLDAKEKEIESLKEQLRDSYRRF